MEGGSAMKGEGHGHFIAVVELARVAITAFGSSIWQLLPAHRDGTSMLSYNYIHKTAVPQP
jgi:hypothetical protein